VAVGVARQVVLVFGLGLPERPGRHDLGERAGTNAALSSGPAIADKVSPETLSNVMSNFDHVVTRVGKEPE
jgi:hypothetical protein